MAGEVAGDIARLRVEEAGFRISDFGFRICGYFFQSAIRNPQSAILLALAPHADGACCYFSAKNADILQPAQKAFITWNPEEKVESFTVQPKFEGNADDFGMVIPTPSKPKLDEMPRDFFKELAVFSILKKREQPHSLLLPVYRNRGGFGRPGQQAQAEKKDGHADPIRPPAVKVLEAGVVGNLDYKIIEAGRADDLFTWLKENKYSYSGDEGTLDFYIQKRLGPRPSFPNSCLGTHTPKLCFGLGPRPSFPNSCLGTHTPKLCFGLGPRPSFPNRSLGTRKTKRLAVPKQEFGNEKDEAVSRSQTGVWEREKGIFGSNELPGKADDWLKAIQADIPGLLDKGNRLGFNFVSGQRPQPNKDGHIATTLEWARKLTAEDIKVLKGQAAYAEKVPDVDEGFSQADLRDPKKAEAVYKVIRERLAECQRTHPGGYLVREAPADDLKALQVLAGHLKEGQFVTKFRKTFARDEMDDDLLIVPAKLGKAEDWSEYEEILPTSPP